MRIKIIKVDLSNYNMHACTSGKHNNYYNTIVLSTVYGKSPLLGHVATFGKFERLHRTYESK